MWDVIHAPCWGWRPAWDGQGFVDGPARAGGCAVLTEGMSARRAAARFGVSESSAIKWVRRQRETGSVAPSKIGGYKPRLLAGELRDWLLERARRDFTLRGLVAELGERGVKGDYVQVWRFVHAEGLSFKKAFCPPSSCGPRSPAAESNGRSTRGGLIPLGWSSSTRPGPRPTWHPCAGGRRSASASRPRCLTVIGRR